MSENPKFDQKEYNRIWREAHPNYGKNWREAHPDFRDNWNKSNPDYSINYRLKHQKELKEYNRIWYETNPDYNKIYLQTLRYDGIFALSFGTNICAWCGESRIDGLTVDHIHGGGRKHKKEIYTKFYLWLKQNNYPTDDYQVLCSNCQMEKVIINGEYDHIETPTPEQQKKREYNQKRQIKLKFQTLSVYSISPIPFCNVCHTTNFWHLCLDHINGDGAVDRRGKNCNCGYNFYTKLKLLNFPDKDKYQVLCYTCNQIKRIRCVECRKLV